MALPVEKIPVRRFTPEEYMELEEQALEKSEYIDGFIYAMSGSTPKHALITANVIGNLVPGLKKGICRVYSGDLKIASDMRGHFTYPDAVVVCGKPRFHDKFQNVLLNPTVIIEVLSPSTEAYDRGDKFKRYRRIGSLTDYLLIAQDQPLVEHFSKQADGWVMQDADKLSGKIKLKTLKMTLALTDLYDGIEFDTEAGWSERERTRPIQ